MICEVSEGAISVSISKREGSFVPDTRSVHLELRGVSSLPRSVSVNGEEADWDYEEAENTLMIRSAEDDGEIAVQVKP